MSDPKYVVLAIIDDPKKIKEENYNITGASVVAPLVKKIITRMIEIIGIPTPSSKEIILLFISLKSLTIAPIFFLSLKFYAP